MSTTEHRADAGGDSAWPADGRLDPSVQHPSVPASDAIAADPVLTEPPSPLAPIQTPSSSAPDSPVPRAPAAPADPAARHLARLASDGIAFLVYWLVVLLLVSQAVTSVLRPPLGSVAIGLVSGLVCLIWAVFCLAMGVLRGTDENGEDQAPPHWLPVITSLGCLISLGIMRTGAEQPAQPWPSELAVASLVVASITVWLGTVAGAVAGVLMALMFLVLPLLDPPINALLDTPLSGLVTGVVLVALGFAGALALGWLRRSAQQLQRSLDARDELLVREQAVRSATEVAAEVERSLHDTALNTLETIAAHGDRLPPEAVVARCRSDVAQLSRWRSEAGLVDLTEVLDRLSRHAERLGLRLDTQVLVPGPGETGPVPVPPPVLHAFCGAATEALTNVSKHAGVEEATILVVHDVSTLQLLVADEGVGPGAAGGGFGLRGSISERMAAVGGTALMSPGPRGIGTVVALGWQPVPAELPQLATDLLTRVAGVAVAMGTILAGVGSALVVLGWQAYAHPFPALAAPMISVLVAAWLLGEARAGVRISAAHVIAACATYVMVGAIALLADPYCSSLLGEGVTLDARATMIVAVLLLAPRPWVLAALVSTVTATHVLGAMKWNQLWSDCGPATTSAGIYVVAALGAVWLFARRLERVSAEYSQTRAQAIQAEIRIRAQLTVRTEGELWVADTLASAQEMLADIADGRLQPQDAATREDCAAEARFLRSLLAVGRAADGLRRPGRIWLRLLHAARCTVVIRGAFPALPPPPAVVGQVGGVLDTVASVAPGADVTLAVWSDPETHSMMVTAAGPSVQRALDLLAERVALIAGDAWQDFEGDAASVEWIWPRVDATRLAPAR